jgi:hypothetical protein
MSLKAELIKEIYAYGGLYTYQQVENFCHRYGCKISNIERRMREECNYPEADLEAIRSKKGAVIGYRRKQKQQQLF